MARERVKQDIASGNNPQSYGPLEQGIPKQRFPYDNSLLQLQGLGEPAQKSAINRMVAMYDPQIILLQETMGASDSVKKALESWLSGWNFEAVDAIGKSGGLAIGWLTRQIRCENIWGTQSAIGVDVYSRETDWAFTVLNLYGPYQMQLPFWEDLFQKSWWNNPDLIVGGDLKFTKGEAEIWGDSAKVDELSDFFRQKLAQAGVIDVPPIKLTPTRRNRRTGESHIAKRLDRFLIADSLMESIRRICQWVGGFGDSDHNPILLEIAHSGEKPSSPFKFNGDWLNREDFVNLIKGLWITYNPTAHRSAAIHFVENLSRAKQARKKWAHEKNIKDEQELKDLKTILEATLRDPIKAFSTQVDKEALTALEKRRQTLLKE